MGEQLDHVNVTVTDIDSGVEFLRVAFPHFWNRGSGKTDHEDWTERWAHVGTDDLYVCLNESSRVKKSQRIPQEETGINHVGFRVGAVDPLLKSYEELGFRCARIDESPSRLRLYVTDHSGITWEFIQYLSDDPTVRNAYSS